MHGRYHWSSQVLLQLWLDGIPLHLHQIGMFNENPVIESQAKGNGTQVGHKPVEQLLAHGGDWPLRPAA